MRVDPISRAGRSLRFCPYEPHEDTIICRMVAENRTPADIGLELGRSGAGIEQRIGRLRKDGIIPGYSPRRRVPEVNTRVNMDPPLRLRCDDDLVRYTLREGGFPRAVPTSIGTIWAGPDGMPWRHGRAIEAEAA